MALCNMGNGLLLCLYWSEHRNAYAVRSPFITSQIFIRIFILVI